MGRNPVPHENKVKLAEAIGADGKPIVFKSLEPPTQGPIKNLTPVPTREIIGIGFDGNPIYAELKTNVPGSRAALIKQWSDLHKFGTEGYKKGGKIQFAKCGKKITKHQNTSVLPDWKFSDLSDADKTAYKTGMEAVRGTGQDFIFKGHNFGKVGETKAVPTVSAPTLAPSLQTAVDQVSAQNTQNAIQSMKINPIKAYSTKDQSVGSAVGSAGKFGTFMSGIAKPLLAGASAMETIGDNNRMFNAMKEGVKEATMSAMPNKVNRRSDRMILTAGDPYRQAAQRQLSSNIPMTNDPIANMQMQQQKFDGYNQMMLQGDLAERDEIIQKDMQRISNQRMYDELDQNVANHAKQMMGQMKGSLAQLEASRQAANSQSKANLRQQLLGFKKGGKMRSTPEQLWLDQNKSTNKFISQLNKQAFELLKMLLS